MRGPSPDGIPMVGPHSFTRRRWRPWICDFCFAPRSLHPRTVWARMRPRDQNYYLSKEAPHFTEDGW